jgi:hypothetical protein
LYILSWHSLWWLFWGWYYLHSIFRLKYFLYTLSEHGSTYISREPEDIIFDIFREKSWIFLYCLREILGYQLYHLRIFRSLTYTIGDTSYYKYTQYSESSRSCSLKRSEFFSFCIDTCNNIADTHTCSYCISEYRYDLYDLTYHDHHICECRCFHHLFYTFCVESIKF